jgi:hypothetical protein
MVSTGIKKNTLNIFKYLILSISLIFLSAKSASGQTADRFDFERIEDNSFLIEEAYNQDPGVIQHISSFQYMKGNTWVYSFTDEWPVPGQKHQLSTSIPLINNGDFGIGDIALNYRYQAIYKSRFAFSPRFSVLLPTGNFRKALGAGVPGYQINMPFSFLVSRMIATHYNFGLTFTPGAKDELGLKSNQTSFNYGFSIILLLKKNFNFMLEVAGSTTSLKSTNLAVRNSSTLFINPGIRYAINFKSGLQIVPGVAAPIGVGPSHGEYGVFAYLSFEHPLWKPKS